MNEKPAKYYPRSEWYYLEDNRIENEEQQAPQEWVTGNYFIYNHFSFEEYMYTDSESLFRQTAQRPQLGYVNTITIMQYKKKQYNP